MKKYIIIGSFLAVFALLWFTKDVHAEVKASKDAVQPYTLVQVVDEANIRCTLIADPGMEGRCAKVR